MTHTIRLTEHWTCEATLDGVRYRRHFGSPRTLAAGERVWLVSGPVGSGELMVNDAMFPLKNQRIETDITPLLRARNEAVLDAATPVEPWPEIVMEIRS